MLKANNCNCTSRYGTKSRESRIASEVQIGEQTSDKDPRPDGADLEPLIAHAKTLSNDFGDATIILPSVRRAMATILCISPQRENPLPPLDVLGHQLHLIDFEPQSLASAPRHDIVILDCRRNLVEARAVARILQAANWQTSLLLVISESWLPAVSSDWGSQDFILEGASLAEVDARIRLLSMPLEKSNPIESASGLVIDVGTFTAKINGKTLDLTFKEFELLRYLHEHPNQVFSREQLLSEVWGYDYFGGTRTVDVHIRRLRAKLGEFEGLIGTVRNVGYRLDPTGSSEN